MGIGHDHSHGHHTTTATTFNKAFFWGILLNSIFVVVEISAGFFSNSMSLIADGGHNFSDVIALILSWIGFKLNQSKSNEKYTYGYKKMSLFIGFLNSLFLCLAVLYLAYESYLRLTQPQTTDLSVMLIVSSIGIVINFSSALLFKTHGHDINIKGAYLHLMADALISLGVVIGAVLIYWTGYHALDPMIAILISVIILWSGWKLLEESFHLMMGKVPNHIRFADVQKFILNWNVDVQEVHFLKIWAISSSENHLICHIKMKSQQHPGNQFLHDLTHALEHQFNIQYSTIQIEVNDGLKACHF